MTAMVLRIKNLGVRLKEGACAAWQCWRICLEKIRICRNLENRESWFPLEMSHHWIAARLQNSSSFYKSILCGDWGTWRLCLPMLISFVVSHLCPPFQEKVLLHQHQVNPPKPIVSHFLTGTRWKILPTKASYCGIPKNGSQVLPVRTLDGPLDSCKRWPVSFRAEPCKSFWSTACVFRNVWRRFPDVGTGEHGWTFDRSILLFPGLGVAATLPKVPTCLTSIIHRDLVPM